MIVVALRYLLWGIAWGAAGLLTGVFLVGYAAPYLPPSLFWWTDLFALALPPLSLAVGLLGLGLLGEGAYRRRWGQIVGAGALIVLLAFRFGPGNLGGGGSGTDAKAFRLMTFNVPMSFAKQEASSRALGRLVRQEAPDVVAFQEAWMATASDSWLGWGGSRWPPREYLDPLGYTLPRALPSETTICQSVLGRLILDSLSVHPFPSRNEETGWCSHYTRTQFTWQNRPVVLYNVHLHTIGAERPWKWEEGWWSLERWQTFLGEYRDGALRRARQARLIRRRLEQEERSILVVGDFNSTPHQWAYRHIAGGLQSTSVRGIWGKDPTYPAHRPLFPIDHILVGPTWSVQSARVPNPKGDTAISDHRPVLAYLRWKND